MMSLKFSDGSAIDGHIADEGDTPEQKLARAQMHAAVRAAMQNLPEQERLLLERHYFGDATLDEASRSLGFFEVVGDRLHARAVEALARDLRRQRVAA